MGADLLFKLRGVRAGVRVTLSVTACGILYALLTWDRPHRAAMLVIATLAVADSLVFSRLPHERLARSGRLDAMHAWWNAGHAVGLTILCVLDGGVGSPYIAGFFLSVAFAAIALPPRLIAPVGALNVAAVLSVFFVERAADGTWAPEAVLWTGALTLTAFVGATIADDRARQLAALQDAKEEMIRRLARVVEYRDNETGVHVERMSAYSTVIARRVGVPEDQCLQLRTASAMHDVGKVGIPDAILLKPGRLTPEEREVMQRHAQVGHDMLTGSGSELLDLAAIIALTHHERWDGGGYPRGLAGEAIPLEGRITAVADVFDALTSDRVYKGAMPLDEAIEEIRANAGTQFDPQVVDAFLAALDEITEIHRRVDGPGERDLRLAA